MHVENLSGCFTLGEQKDTKVRRQKRLFSAGLLHQDDGEHQAWSPFSLLEIYRVSQTMFIVDTQTLINGLLNI